MKKLQTQLNSIAKSLASLTQRVEKISAQLVGTKPKAKPATKRPAAKKKAKAAPAKRKAPAKKAAAAQKSTVLDAVFDVIRKSRNGVNIANLKTKTKLESRQLSNALYKLTKKGKIKSKARGVYIKA